MNCKKLVRELPNNTKENLNLENIAPYKEPKFPNKLNTKVLRPSGTGFKWCINPYDGCSHGCKYCYGMTIRRKTYSDWIKPQPRKDVMANLKNDIEYLRKNSLLHNIKDIMVGSITDSYQPIELEYGITRQIIEVLIENQLPFTIITKGNAILRDIDLLRDYDLCRAGITLISLDEKLREDLEPGATSCDERFDVLRAIESNGIPTYLSCEPIMPVEESNPIEIADKLSAFVSLFEFGKWNRYRYNNIPNHYWKNYSDKYYIDSLGKTIEFCENKRINYCIASHSKDFCDKYGLTFKSEGTNLR